MTSDAKVGLLLGLIFIFIIAFVVNGLPSFLKGKPSNDLTTENVRYDGGKPIGQKERLASREVSDQSVRLQIPVSGNQQAGSSQQAVDSVNKTDQASRADEIKNIVTVGPAERQIPAGEAWTSQVDSNQTVAVKINPPVVQAQPKIYVISEGDSLAFIAKKFYGEEEGNRKINIDRIFEANRNVLKSADEICVGQKIAIPSLVKATAEATGATNISNSPLVEQVPSIGIRHIEEKDKKDKYSEYVVCEGDSLWKIASDKLGDGNRYKEIAGLNKDILSDEDVVAVGMRLKLPAK